MIFRYAVYTEEPIVPLQVSKRSNKFVWGNYTNEEHPDFWWLKTPTEEPLTIIQLNQTCRRIYSDLAASPEFYSVNSFFFATMKDLHTYLAAIIPARRAAIHHIVLDRQRPFRLSNYEAHQPWANKRLIPLLHYCTSLRRLSYVGEDLIGWEYEPAVRDVIHNNTRNLQRMLARLQSTPDNAWALWNLPVFKMTPAPYLHEMFASLMPSAASLYTQVIQHLDSHTQRLMQNHRQGLGLTTFVNRDHLDWTVSVADVDLPGEVRITQDISNSTNGTIATRTRGRCRLENKRVVMGVFISTDQGDIPRYDENGMLNWKYSKITKLSWCDTGIECELVLKDKKPITWTEKLDAVLTNWDMHHIARLYWRLLDVELDNTADSASRLSQLKSMPSPNDIVAYRTDFLEAWGGWHRQLPEFPDDGKDTGLENLERRFRETIKRLEDTVSTI